MKRRDFLVNALAAGALGSGLVPLPASRAAAATAPARVLVNVMLAGGPDLRHLFPPAFNTDPASVGYRFWQAKASAHAIGDTPASWPARWDNDYFHASFGGTAFGIRSNCGWLRQFWDDGHVAIVANAVGARTRDHAHCIMVLEGFIPSHAFSLPIPWHGVARHMTGAKPASSGARDLMQKPPYDWDQGDAGRAE